MRKPSAQLWYYQVLGGLYESQLPDNTTKTLDYVVFCWQVISFKIWFITNWVKYWLEMHTQDIAQLLFQVYVLIVYVLLIGIV